MASPIPDLKAKPYEIADHLRREIVLGRLAPGHKLPTWNDLQARYSVCRPTLTRAMDLLKRDGFLRTRKSQGTFVHDRPPHLVRYGLVFSSHPSRQYIGQGGWNRFWHLLATLGPKVAESDGVEMPVFYEVSGHDSPGEKALIADIKRRRVGGLIVVGATELMQSLPAIQQYPLPMVAIYDGSVPMSCPRVYVDRRSFIKRSLAVMRGAGRRRVAVLHLAGQAADVDMRAQSGGPRPLVMETAEWFATALREGGFQSPEHWQLFVGLLGATNTVRVLLDLPAAIRPDGLIIADDNLADRTLSAVVAAGLRIPDELTIVAHANWPSPSAQVVPTIRLGYDVYDVLTTALRTLRDVQAGCRSPDTQLVPALLEQDVAKHDLAALV